MTYAELEASALTGDLISVSGKGVISHIIRKATSGKMSHTAILYWAGTHLMVYEFKEFVGQRFMPAGLFVADQIERGAQCYWNEAPLEVHMASHRVVAYLMSRRKEPYGYKALATVLWAQWRGTNPPTDALVCSVVAQRAYEACGVEFSTLASPDSITDVCVAQRRLRG